MSDTLRYTYRLRPGASALAGLNAEWGRCRWVWNQCVVAGRAAKRQNSDSLFLDDKDLTAVRKNVAWLAEGSQNAQQQVMRDYRRKKAAGQGGRKRKKKHARPSLNYTRNGFRIKNERLVLAGGIVVPVVWSRDLPSDPSSVRIYQDPLGHWYASFVVTREQQPLPATGKAIGIDWGVAAIATTTDPEFDLPHHGYGKRNAARLARYQRMMARRRRAKGQTPSKRYLTAKRHAAKAHKKVARQRQDTARKWVRKIVAAHDQIAVEDFKPAFLAKSTMARKAADNAVGATKATLLETAERTGRTVVPVAPAYTTMTCSICGTTTKDRIPLNQRTFTCPAPDCGVTADRDRNAARTILALAGFNQADADAVRRAQDCPSGSLRHAR